jgi:hypothetical protein
MISKRVSELRERATTKGIGTASLGGVRHTFQGEKGLYYNYCWLYNKRDVEMST